MDEPPELVMSELRGPSERPLWSGRPGQGVLPRPPDASVAAKAASSADHRAAKPLASRPRIVLS